MKNKILSALLWATLAASLLVAGPPPRGPGFNPHILFGTVERVREAQKVPTPPPTAPTPIPTTAPTPVSSKEALSAAGLVLTVLGFFGFVFCTVWHFAGGVLPGSEDNCAGSAAVSAAAATLGLISIGGDDVLAFAGLAGAATIVMGLEWHRCRQ